MPVWQLAENEHTRGQEGKGDGEAKGTGRQRGRGGKGDGEAKGARREKGPGGKRGQEGKGARREKGPGGKRGQEGKGARRGKGAITDCLFLGWNNGPSDPKGGIGEVGLYLDESRKTGRRSGT